MKAKLVVEGKEFDIEILDPKLQELITPKKKTGYERVEQGKGFWCQNGDGTVMSGYDHHNVNCNNYFDHANYYSDMTVAEDNARADNLMRQLRRFAVEHRVKELSWNIGSSYKWNISYDYHEELLFCHQDIENRALGAIYFDSKSHAKLAIETFRDELIWYFTEYKDSL
jgi:hypothetical protein